MTTIHSTSPVAEGIERFCSGLILSDERFEALSKQAAIDLKENRSAYFTRVALMAAMGYCYIGLIVSIGVGGLLFIAYSMWQSHHLNFAFLKILLVVGIIVFGMLRALWLKYPPPEGVPITEQDAPALFELIDRYKTELNTQVDKVLINDDFNAFVTQIPRLGFLGMHTNYLVLGLPLMSALDADQFKAVLAHELGHLSGNHSKSSAWIYGLRARWSQLLNVMRQDSPFIFAIFYVFFSWLAPRFNAYTMAMAREHELDADRDSERIAGGGNVGSSLVLVHLKGRYLSEQIWTEIIRSAADSPTPATTVFRTVTDSLRGLPVENAKVLDWLKQAIKQEGSGSDTHPALCERLAARNLLGEYKEASQELLDSLKKPIEPGQSAAEVLLGRAFPTLIEDLSRTWHDSAIDFWTDKHQFFQRAKKRLEEMEEKAQTEEGLTLEEMREKAYFVSEMQGVDKCRPFLEEILEKFPGDPMANCAVGVMLLEEGKEEGVELLEKAMAGRVSLVPECYGHIKSYLAERGRESEADKYEGKLLEYSKESELAQKERTVVTAVDTLLPHELDEAWVEGIGKVLVHFKMVQAAYLVRKQVNYFPDYPYLVLAIDTKGSAEEKVEVAKWLLANLGLPNQFCVVPFDGSNKKVKENVLKVEGAKIYSV